MSVIATAVRHLMAAGVTGEALLTAIAEMEEQIRSEPKPRSSAAIRQERYRRNKASQTVTSDACDEAPPLSRPPNENISNPPTHTPPDIYPARVKADDFPRLDCAKPEVWRDFLKNRKAKRLPCTATAHKRLERDLEAMAARIGWPPGEVFEACVGKGWGAIYDPREKQNGRTNTDRQTAPDGRTMGKTEAAVRALAARVAGPSECGGNNHGSVALPDNRRAIGYVER